MILWMFIGTREHIWDGAIYHIVLVDVSFRPHDSSFCSSKKYTRQEVNYDTKFLDRLNRKSVNWRLGWAPLPLHLPVTVTTPCS